MAEEVWTTVARCPAYEVSSSGRVRRLLPGKRTTPGRLLRPSRGGGRGKYHHVTLVMNGVRQDAMVHRLVCEAFHGLPPSPLHEVAHSNGIGTDNRAENLSWKLHRANSRDRVIHGTQTCGEHSNFAKLSADKVLEIRRRHAEDRTGYRTTADEFGVVPSLVSLIARGKIWKHIN